MADAVAAGAGGGDASARILRARVVSDELSVAACSALVQAASAGAMVTFEGVVRDHDAGRGVTALEYESHPTANEVILAVALAVAEAHPVVAIAVEHRVGALVVGDVALAAAVSSAHRAEAFVACAELIDEIKAHVPIWKKQDFVDGTSEWVASLG